MERFITRKQKGNAEGGEATESTKRGLQGM
jgi:hypothetical protein